MVRAWPLLVCLLLTGCQAGAAPLEALPTPTSVPVAAAPPPPPTALPTRPPTAVPTSVPTLVPTSTPRPTVAPTKTPVPPTPTPAQPTPTPDARRVVQRHYCDTASPPAHLDLPPLQPTIHISPPEAATISAPIEGGPRREGTEAPPRVSAAHIAVMDEATGVLLYAQDPFTRAAPASITKIVTTIVALEHVPDITTQYVTTVSASALVACDGSSVMGLEPNDRVKLGTLLYGMMLPSGNDAAEQVAYSLGGTRAGFVRWMNEKVASLGLRDTHFVTPSGMDADEHYSSAYDMAILGRYAMQNPVFRQVAATTFIVSDDYYMRNLNPLLGNYEGADGVKIGYTDIAGRTFVASATREGHRVYVSLMGSANLHGDSTRLFDWVWNNYRW